MKKNTSIFIFFLFLAAIAGISDAKFISIETSTSLNISGEKAQVVVLTKNKGDEPAYNLKVSVEIGGRQFEGLQKEALSLNEQYRAEFNVAPDFKKPGRYPVVVNVDYTDANLYPFSALSAVYINYKDALNARAAGVIAPVTLSKKGRISLEVNNMDSMERTFRFRLIAPKEMLIANPEGDVTVGPGMGKTVSFDVKNISALPGSVYPVFALLGYEDDKHYYSTVSAGNITIVKEKSFLDAYKWLLFGILAVLIAVVVFYNYGRSGDRGAKA